MASSVGQSFGRLDQLRLGSLRVPRRRVQALMAENLRQVHEIRVGSVAVQARKRPSMSILRCEDSPIRSYSGPPRPSDGPERSARSKPMGPTNREDENEHIPLQHRPMPPT